MVKARSPAWPALTFKVIPLTWANLQAVSNETALLLFILHQISKRERRMLVDDTAFVIVCPSKTALVDVTTNQQQIQIYCFGLTDVSEIVPIYFFSRSI